MTATKRLYIIRNKVDAGARPRLVKAFNASQALHHVAVDTLSVSVPTQDELIAAIQAGIAPESTGKPADE